MSVLKSIFAQYSNSKTNIFRDKCIPHKWALRLVVKVLTLHIGLLGFGSWLWILTPASHQFKPRKEVVMAQVTAFLPPK